MTLAVSIVVAAVIVSATVLFFATASYRTTTVTRKSTETVTAANAGTLTTAITHQVTLTITLMSPTTATVMATVSSTGTVESCGSAPSLLHCVVFQQVGACSPKFWGVPWSVTIANTTEVQPPGTRLPLNGSVLYGTEDENLTVIVFSLPDGVYGFRVSPSAGFFTPTTGSVRVNGTDALVPIAYTGTSCTSAAAGGPAAYAGPVVLTKSEWPRISRASVAVQAAARL